MDITVTSFLHLTRTRTVLLQTVPRPTSAHGGTKDVTALILMVFTCGAAQPMG